LETRLFLPHLLEIVFPFLADAGRAPRKLRPN
jgi:hypothetical protein